MAASILDALVRPAAGCENLRPSTVSPHVSPIAALAIKGGVRGLKCSERMEPVYGGYANGRGDVVLFGKEIAFGVNFRTQTLKQRPPLNLGAQTRYDATAPGEDFAFGNKTFRRLSHQEIADICAGGGFRVGSRF